MTLISKRPNPRDRGWIRRLTMLIDNLSAFDLDAINSKVSKLEETLFSTEASLRRIVSLLHSEHHSVPFLRLISMHELATADRFELERRCHAMTNPAYLGDCTILCRILGSYKLYLDTRDTGFASHVMLDGYWEMWLTIFFARQLRPGMTVIDVGANFGYYTVLFGALVGNAGHVYAFEPNPEVTRHLHRSVDLNGFRSRTTIVAAAAGATDGEEVTLVAPHGEPKNGSIVDPTATISPDSGAAYIVPQVTVDRATKAAARVDFVKIDAEGAEEHVITGMMHTLVHHKPKMVLEFNAARYSDARCFLERLQTIYNKIYYINFEGEPVAAPIDEIISDHSGEDWLLYLVSSGHGEAISSREPPEQTI